VPGIGDDDPNVILDGKAFAKDEFTNLTAPVVGLMKRKLLHQQHHPLNLVKQHAINYFDKHFIGRTGNPVFSVYDNLNPVVTVEENFDSLLIPEDHVSRRVSDTYYVNRKHLLRSHATAHQAELVGMGLDNFLIFGDCYRRDEIDSSHYPVFHQLDGVYTVNEDQVSYWELRLQIEIPNSNPYILKSRIPKARMLKACAFGGSELGILAFGDSEIEILAFKN